MSSKTKRKNQSQLDDEETNPLSDPTWACPKCTLCNAATRKRCGACESRRPIYNVPMGKDSPQQSVTGDSHLQTRKRKRDEVPHEIQLVNDQHQVSVKLSLGGNSKSWRRLKAWLPPNPPKEERTVLSLSTGSKEPSLKSTKKSLVPDANIENAEFCNRVLVSPPVDASNEIKIADDENCGTSKCSATPEKSTVSPLSVGSIVPSPESTNGSLSPNSKIEFACQSPIMNVQTGHSSTPQSTTSSYSLRSRERRRIAVSDQRQPDCQHQFVVKLSLGGKSSSWKPLTAFWPQESARHAHTEGEKDVAAKVDTILPPSLPNEESTVLSSSVDIAESTFVEADKCDTPCGTKDEGYVAEKRTLEQGKTVHQNKQITGIKTVGIKTVGQRKPTSVSRESKRTFDVVLRKKPSDLVSFHTAGKGNKVHVSDEGLRKADEVWCYESRTVKSRALENGKNAFGCKQIVTLATTGQSKPIVISGDSLDRSSILLDVPSVNIVGFHTAGRGCVVHVSEEGLRKVNEIWDSECHATGKRPLASVESSDHAGRRNALMARSTEQPRVASANLVSFHTAGRGTLVQVSEDALKKANDVWIAECHATGEPALKNGKNRFEAAGQSSPTTILKESLGVSGDVLERTPANVVGFHTAGRGSLIHVTEEALKKADIVCGSECRAFGKRALENSENANERKQVTRLEATGRRCPTTGCEESLDLSDELLGRTPAIAVGFHTAGRRDLVHVSEESMKKADKVWGSGSLAAEERHNPPIAISTIAKPESFARKFPDDVRQLKAGSYSIEPPLIADGVFVSPELRNGLQRITKTRYDTTRPRDVELFQTPVDRFLTRNLDSILIAHGEFSSTNVRASKAVAVTVEAASRNASQMIDALCHDDLKMYSAFQPPGWQTEEMAPNEESAEQCGNKEVAPPHKSRLCAQHEAALLEKSTAIVTASRCALNSESTFLTGFRSADNRKEITVSDESTTNGFQGADKHNVFTISVEDVTVSGSALSACFHSAGKRTKIAVSEYSMARAALIFNEPTLSSGIHIPGNHTETFASKESMARTASIVIEPTSSHGTVNGTKPTVLEDFFAKTDKVFGGGKRKASLNSAGTTRNSAGTTHLLQTTAESGSARLLSRSKNALLSDRPCRSLSIQASSATTNVILSKRKTSTGILPALSNALRIGQMSENHQACVDDGVPETTICVNSVNAASVRFHKKSGLPCYFSYASGISAEIVGTEKDIYQELVDRSCKSPSLTLRWIGNHSRWIIWKLASMERRFSAFLACRYLTYNHLLARLMERYDREIVRGQRSAIRKILNKDASAGIPMILCVAQVLKSRDSSCERNVLAPSVPQYRVELTDGWYSVEATLDGFLSQKVQSGTIAQGTKLMICDAKLEGLEEGVDPLESSYYPLRSPKSISLRLCANGTRLAKWNAKLGFVAPSRRIVAQGGKVLVHKVSDIIPDGGNIPLMELIVSRRYPKLFLQQPVSDKKLQPVKKSIVLTEAEYFSISKNLEKRKEQVIEKVLDEVRQECEQDIDDIAPASWRLVARSESPDDVYQGLDGIEKLSVDRWKLKREALLQNSIHKAVSERIIDDESLQECRSVPFVRLLVKSTDSKKSLKCEEATLTVWNPSDDQLEVLEEGAVVRFRELAVRPNRFDGLLQLTASFRTSMELLSRASASSGYAPRKVLNVFRITCASKKVLQTEKQPVRPTEVDTTGTVFKVFASQQSRSEDARIYLTDESGLVLRIQGKYLLSASDSHGHSISTHVECKRQSIVTFRDLRLLPYDSLELCAVAETTNTSSRSISSQNARTNQLMSWASSSEGRMKLRHVAACLDAEVPYLETPGMGEKIAFGYIAGFSVTYSKRLQISVDCQGDQLHKWNFPILLLQEAMDACTGSVVSLNAEDDATAGQLKLLGDLFRARSVLLRFCLRRIRSSDTVDGFSYEVCHVQRANVGALASLHLALSENCSTLKRSHSEAS